MHNRLNDENVNNIIFCLFLSVGISIFICVSIHNAYAHIPQDNSIVAPVQEWKNTQNNVKIQFSYIPKKPLVYTNTDLIFSIQNLTNGNHIEDLIASITIAKNDKIFLKFNGNYQVIGQISSTDNIAVALASFDILVPLQPFGKFNADSLASSLIPAGLVATGLSAIVIALILILRKGEKSR